MSKGIGGHHRAFQGKTDEWLTPPEILEKLGKFDLDPCAPVNRPWDVASQHYTIEDDGLSKPWTGRCFVNPPYGPETGKWLARLASHGDGIAIVFARTETEMFHAHVWRRAKGILFLKGRLHFHYPDGTKAKCNAGGPSVLVGYSDSDAKMLSNLSPSLGAFVGLSNN